MSMNNSNYTIGIRTRDLPACSAGPPNVNKSKQHISTLHTKILQKTVPYE